MDMLLRTIEQVNITSEMGKNETALGCFLSENLPEIQASAELKGFFAAWNIKVVPDTEIPPSPIDSELDAQLAIAFETSRYEIERRQTEEGEQNDKDKNVEHGRKLLLQELDIVNCAIQHRLVRWAGTYEGL